MRAGVSEAVVGDVVGHDFLFTWKHGYRYDLRKLIDAFRSKGIAKERWSCAAHKQIHPGDRAYLLKQGKPIGIFGRGTVVGNPVRELKTLRGQSRWKVLIGFEMSRGDVLSNPEDRVLVDGSHLLDLPAPKTQWQLPASGNKLEPEAARGIDSIINSILIGRGQTTPVDEAVLEVARQKKLIEQMRRPDQQLFSEKIRRNYRDKCAVTRCATPAALEAAHISIRNGQDDNSLANGILLRSDIHALFDRLLITLSEDGTRIEVSPQLTDPSYIGLKTVVVARPDTGPPSAKNIREHRNRFFERLRRPC
jgi:hypothetical protein